MIGLDPIVFLAKAAGRLLLAFTILVVLSGCMPLEQQAVVTGPLADLRRDSQNSARISCFLNISNDHGPAIKLDVDSLEILTDNNQWLKITSGPLKLDSAGIGTAGQVFLGGRAVPPGHYRQLRLSVSKGEVRKFDGTYEVVVSESFQQELNIATDLYVDPEDSHTLLIDWDIQRSLLADKTLDPFLVVFLASRQLPRNLIFVSCPDIDTVYTVRSDKNWVVDSFGLKGHPTYLALDPDTSSQRLYVLTPQDRMVKVIDLSTHRVVDFFPAPLNDEPTFMAISADGQSAFLLDERSGYVSRMDLDNGQIDSRVLLGFRPKYAAYLEDQNLLAVSMSLSQKILLLDPVSLEEKWTISTGSSPQGLVASDNQLYIAEYGDNTVSVVDLAGNGNQSRMTVGFGPTRLLDTGNQLFVSNYEDGSLSVLEPGLLGVIQEIYGLGSPKEMVFDSFYRRLYAADEQKAALAVIDTNINLLLGHISFGAKPFGLAVLE